MSEPDNARIASMGPVDASRSPFARLRTLPFSAVTPTGGFWHERRLINRRVSLLRCHEMLERAGNLELLAAAAAGERRDLDIVRFPPAVDTDVYKWLEAVAWAAPDGLPVRVAELAEQAIQLIERAQRADGYVNSFYQVAFPHLRWANLAYSHELYTAGHLIQAAIAWMRAVGDGRLLAVAIRFADHIDEVFGPGRRIEPDGHPEIETALVELYRLTAEPRYLALARFFLDQRGHGLLGDHAGRWFYGSREYFQDHQPVRDTLTMEGHAVRGLYLVTGVVDDYLESGDARLLRAAERQWRDLVRGKLYLTGGIGQRPETEGFGEPYELPSARGYCETCAAVASVQWNWRLLLATGKARYAELIERTLYNAVLVGVSVDGRKFFYGNPLESNGEHRRAAWYYVACCPPNLMRLLASIGHYVASRDGGGIQIHQYVDADLATPIPAGNIALEIRTEMPWEGRAVLRIVDAPPSAWTLSLRIPTWADAAEVRAFGDGPRKVRPGHYTRVRRRWRPGDQVTLDLPMSPRLVEAHPLVEATRGRVAVERGPLVYCFEACDQEPQIDLAGAALDAGSPVLPAPRAGWAHDATVLRARGRAVRVDRGGALYRAVGTAVPASARDVVLTAVPYFLWANRQRGAMRVWLPRLRAGLAP